MKKSKPEPIPVMDYEETEKKEIERVYAVFADYIRESPYLEWFWSDKLGYLLLKIGAEKRYIAENVIIYTAEQLARILFSEVSMDVLQMTGNDHTEQTADPLEFSTTSRAANTSWAEAAVPPPSTPTARLFPRRTRSPETWPSTRTIPMWGSWWAGERTGNC